MENSNVQKNILFYDGVCGLCQKAIQFCLKHDVHQQIFYSPLQGETFENLKHPAKPSVEDVLGQTGTLVYYARGQIFTRSDAALNALIDLGSPWSFAKILKVIPKFLRDLAYKFVAHYRYDWFGKSDTCYIPLSHEAERFLP